MNTNISSYLKECNVQDSDYLSFVLDETPIEYNFVLYSVEGFDFVVSHFFNNSDELGYWLIPTNKLFKNIDKNRLAFGLFEGDGVICMDLASGGLESVHIKALTNKTIYAII